ncbi:bifunctional 2-polyprenyl-6-hydroxyphenol methylase/3-demethylubiquinol 3-O-methyltransferase UbiG [Streptomyces sp. PAM3C]|uniref:class I SAM-dependent methyltransferase n=1 Tax=Streptomyces sp. PAM3C TaxID=2847300 RepID=UPI001C1DEF93|nr:class I SAM-dependent methyltransferase [Streptomyces sp. PAM3C]MBU5946828.1 class I SAM-dependent methyltransferase [Streptomyces sp. PAM3C]
MTDTAIAWDTYARQRPERRPVNSRGETTWFNWTQYADHGPGVELLGVPAGSRVLDLGCGKGGNVAHLAAIGARAVGVDISPQQLTAARERWGQLPGVELHQAEAAGFLREDREGFDAVYSVYGAVWFTDPALLLPAIRERLRPGGRLVFSQRPPVEGCYGCQASYIPRGADEDPLVVRRWDYEPHVWEQLLVAYGFGDVRTRVLAAPPGPRTVGTLIVQARA